MRLPIVPLLVVVVLNIVLDAYIYVALRRRQKSHLPSRVQLWSSIALFVMIAVAVCLPRTSGSNSDLLAVMWMIYVYIAVYMSKLVFVLLDLVGHLPCLFRKKSWRWMSWIAMACGMLTFGSLMWASLVNRFRIDVKDVDVMVESLPESFDGYRIVQVSDLHVGTFASDTAFVSTLVDRINSLDADLVVFTGDIVNSRTAELLPHVEPLSRLTAADGVLSILGNHDYGDYAVWPSPEAKAASMQLMKDLQGEMGWRLLLNDNEIIRRGTDSIAVIGVENIGDPPFHVYGSLTGAYPDLSDGVTKILLTHNPAHWTDSIASNRNVNVALSLSGHTHAMQIELFGWSPAEYRYPTWGGLYADDDRSHQLYVNIGAGTVGLPARLGATPEITVITLKKAKNLH